MRSIALENCSAVQQLTIPVPEEGGIVVLRGTNDIGKSEAIQAVTAAISGRGTIEATRGTPSGSIAGLGITVKFGRSTRRAGELEVDSLEGKFAIEDLIEPQIKNELAADAKRIKTLLSLVGVEASPAMFAQLFGGLEPLLKIISKEALSERELVPLAARIKADAEQHARAEESRAATARDRAAVVVAMIDALPEEVRACTSTPAEAGQALQAAIQATLQAKAQLRAYNEQRDKWRQAMAELTGLRTEDYVERQRSLMALHDQRQRDCDSAKDKVVELEKLLRSITQDLKHAQAALATSQRELETSCDELRQHRANAERIATLENAVASSVDVAPVTDDEVKDLATQEAEAERRYKVALQAEECRRLVAEAEAKRREATEHERRGQAMREAAGGIETVLSEAVSKCGTKLRVSGGRLLVDTPQGPKTFAELSHGTRSKMAVDIAIEAVGKGGLITLRQEFWEGIAPANKLALAEHVKGRGVVILTAQATDDPSITTEIL